MAIQLRFINLIVRRDKIEEKYPGGWEQCLKDHEAYAGGRTLFDEHLFRDGAMNPLAMQILYDHWISLGFEGEVQKDGKSVWGDDMCVAETMRGATRPCAWLAFDTSNNSVHLQDADPGPVVTYTFE